MATGPVDWRGFAFMVVWLVFWAAGMILVAVALGGAALRGEVGAIFFMAIWLCAAGFALTRGARQLRGLILGEPRSRRSGRVREWHDGISDRADKG